MKVSQYIIFTKIRSFYSGYILISHENRSKVWGNAIWDDLYSFNIFIHEIRNKV